MKRVKVLRWASLGLAGMMIWAGVSCGGSSLPQGPDLRKPNAAELPRMWLVSVGVSKYEASEFKLDYADADAKAVDEIFAEPRGPVPEGRRMLLVNEQVKRASVLGALKEVGNRSAENDVIVLFMAMHGIKRENEPFYFMAHDTDPSNLMATGIRDSEVTETLKEANAKKHVVLIDACHAGGFGLDTSFRAIRAEATGDLLRGFQSVSGGTGVLAAAAPSEYSEENERWGGGHGVFTYHLVEGLRRGAVDENKDGVATLRELFDYVYDRVKKEREGKQHPDFKGEGEIPIMAYDWKPQPTVMGPADEEKDPVAAQRPATKGPPKEINLDEEGDDPTPPRKGNPKEINLDEEPTPPERSSVEGMIQLPGGTFRMSEGGNTVNVSSFYLDVTEVTVGAYKVCVDAGPCSRPDSGELCNWGKSGRENHPINCVDWSQAVAYCGWKGKRLPAEQEWEWAARGASRGTTYPWGNGVPAGQLCWDGKGNDKGEGNRRSTCAVGSYPAGDSPQGIKDLAGNVWEWTSSPYGSGGRYRVSRGGGWDLIGPFDVRAAKRDGFMPEYRSNYIGIRCAR